MEPARSFQDLGVWKKAHELVLIIYKETFAFPKEEMYGLTSQIRRAAYSVPMNIPEGFKRRTDADKLRFYNFSQTSLEEVRYCLILSKDLNYINNTEILHQLLEEVSKMLHAYIKTIENNK